MFSPVRVLPVCFGFHIKEAYSLHAHSDISQVIVQGVGEFHVRKHILSNLAGFAYLEVSKYNYNHCKKKLLLGFSVPFLQVHCPTQIVLQCPIPRWYYVKKKEMRKNKQKHNHIF